MARECFFAQTAFTRPLYSGSWFMSIFMDDARGKARGTVSFLSWEMLCVCCVERIDFISEGDLLVNGVTRRLSDIIKSEVAFNVFMDH